MILFISPYPNAKECAALIEPATREQVSPADSIRLAFATIGTRDFSAVVAAENFLECTPGSADTLLQRMQSAVPIVLDKE